MTLLNQDRRSPFGWTLLVLVLMLVPVACGLRPASGGPQPPAAAGVLDLPDDGFLTGRLAPAAGDPGQPRTTLLWQSPLFAEPVEFAIAGINRIRFPKAKAAAPGVAAWRAELAGDDSLIGSLESIDADHVVLDVAGLGQGPLRLRREEVVRLTRTVSGEASQQVILPGPIAGWDADRAAWQDVAGRLACRTPGKVAFRGLQAPRRVCFDILLSWDERPDLEIRLATRQSDEDSYRLETMAGDLVAVREGKTAAVDRVATLPAEAGSVRLLVFIDQDRGRMAVLVPNAGDEPAVAFDEVVPPAKAAIRGGFGVLLRSGDVRIDRLRVSPWEGAEPKLTATVGLGGQGVAVESFDKGTASFTVRDAAGQRQVAAEEVSEVTLAAPASGRPPGAGTVLAAFHTGGRLTGRLLELTPDSLRLDCPALADPVTCRLDSLAALESAAEPAGERLPGPRGILEAEGGRVAGCLADAAVPGTGITWLPLGGVRPVAIADTASGVRISYPGKAAPPAARVRGEAWQAVVYLKTGESLRCEVLAAGPEGLRIKTAVAPDLLVPAIVLRAVELLPAAAASMAKTAVERLLTLPRSQQSDPPTHLLRLTSGDYLRGKLVSLDDLSVVITVAGVPKQLPRSSVARLIWLSIEGDGSGTAALEAMAAGEAGEGMPLRAMLKDGRRLTMRATGLEGSQLVGQSGVLGRVGVDLAECGRIDLRPAGAAISAKDLPFGQWKLRPAVLPRALRDEPQEERAKPEEGQPAGAEAAPAGPGGPPDGREDAELRAFAAAREAALAEDRGCLTALGKLLDAESELVRRQSIALLRRITGLSQKAMPYKPDAANAEREEQAWRWRQWLAVNGISAELSFPRPAGAGLADAPPLAGRTLVCGSDRVVELDEEGNETFEVKADGPWACDVTVEGRRIIGEHGGRAIVEYDDEGQQVWAVRNLPGGPMSVRRLENGNTLVALSDANLVAEYDPQGKQAWTAKVAGRPCDARRLPDGRTLVAAHRANRIVELDARGQEVWVVEGIDDPQTAQRLPDGNTLVAMSVPGIIREIDRQGRTVWEQGGFKTPVDVQRLPDGTTLVQEQGGDLVELDAGGTEVDRRPTGGNRFLRW